MQMPTNFIFVYGTLKSGYGNNRILNDSEYVRTTILPGIKLYNAGFPVAKFDPESAAVGEVWDISGPSYARTLQRLDTLESNGTMYDRVYLPKEDLSLYIGCDDFWDFDRLPLCDVVNPEYQLTTYEWSR